MHANSFDCLFYLVPPKVVPNLPTNGAASRSPKVGFLSSTATFSDTHPPAALDDLLDASTGLGRSMVSAPLLAWSGAASRRERSLPT